MSRRRAFTLIELLVVIAIIGILAAMVFPVFARARESARKAVCLSNVKNIALAIQMYLADNNDTFWTGEHRQDVHDFFNAVPGQNAYWEAPDCGDRSDLMSFRANPYLRPQVVMDEYVKNRDVWRCPSAKMEAGAMRIVAGPDWFAAVRANADRLGDDICLKDGVFPPGWGGSITDSFVQGEIGGNAVMVGWGSTEVLKAFRSSVGVNGYHLIDQKMAAIDDAANYVVAADVGAYGECFNAGTLAYADLCNVECGNCTCSSWIEDCADSIQSGCPDAYQCFLDWHTSSTMLKNQELLKKGARHLGGTNIGFADGHASWMSSGRWLDKWADEAKANGGWPSAFGVDAWGPMSWCGIADTDPTQPTLR